jgi:hypothetical protein
MLHPAVRQFAFVIAHRVRRPLLRRAAGYDRTHARATIVHRVLLANA